MFNLRTAAARQREWLRQLRLQQVMERGMRRRLAREFNAVAHDATERFDGVGDEQDVEAALRAHEVRLLKIITAFYNGATTAFSQRALQNITKSGGRYETKDTEERLNRRLQQFVRTTAAKKVTQISDTTRKQIKRAISDGLRDELSVAEIAKAITSSVGGSIGLMRADVIARTETHSASQAGSLLAAESTGVVQTKEWVSVEDERARPDHIAANGQVVPLNQPFTVGGHKLAYPGDPSGPAEEVINCRCVLVYGVSND